MVSSKYSNCLLKISNHQVSGVSCPWDIIKVYIRKFLLQHPVWRERLLSPHPAPLVPDPGLHIKMSGVALRWWSSSLWSFSSSAFLAVKLSGQQRPCGVRRPPLDLPTVSSVRRACVWEGRWNNGSSCKSSGRVLSLGGLQSNLTNTKSSLALPVCFPEWMRRRQATKASEWGDQRGPALPSSALDLVASLRVHSSAVSNALRVSTSTTRPPWRLSSNSCEWSHGTGPMLHCCSLLQQSTLTLKPWLPSREPSWDADFQTPSSTPGGFSSTTWPFPPTSERETREPTSENCTDSSAFYVYGVFF